MKLLERPRVTMESLQVGGAHTEIQTSFNPLGIFGFGPIFKIKEVKRSSPSLMVSGKAKIEPPLIDFEDENLHKLLIVEEYPGTLKKTGRVLNLELNGDKFEILGAFPIDNVRDNVWTIHADAVNMA